MIRLLLLLSLLSVGSFARLNPFEPVDGTDQQINMPKKGIDLNNPDDKDRTVKIISDKKEAQKEAKKESSKPIKNDQKEQLATEIKKTQEKKAIEETPVLKKLEEVTATVPPKKEEMMAKEATKDNLKAHKSSSKTKSLKQKKVKSKLKKSHKQSVSKASKIKKSVEKKTTNSNSTKYKALPLVTIDLKGDNLSISTRNNYKLVQYYEDPNENKFVFDFKANVGVPTERENINSPYYQSYTIGNHPEDGFFRVVIPVKDSVSLYKVLIKDNQGTIIRK